MKRGIVYLIYDSSQNLYKIGVTKGTGEKRLKQLQTGNASELQIIHTHENNQILNEWYELPIEIVLNFKTVCIETENIINIMKDNYFFAKNLR